MLITQASCKQFTLSLPQRCLDPKNGVYENHPDGKVAVTTFQFLIWWKAHWPAKTIWGPALCKPHTGERTRYVSTWRLWDFNANDLIMDPQPKMGESCRPRKVELFTVDICQPAETRSWIRQRIPWTMTKKWKNWRFVQLLQWRCNGYVYRRTTGHEGIWLHAMKYTGSDWSFL